MKKCPYCGEQIQSKAVKCRFCGEWINKVQNSEISELRNSKYIEKYMARNSDEIAIDENEFRTLKEKYENMNVEELLSTKELYDPQDYTPEARKALEEVFNKREEELKLGKQVLGTEERNEFDKIKKRRESMGKRIIKETKCTCASCGNIWFYGKQDRLESTGAAMENLGKNMMCLSGCLPAAFLPSKKVVDLNKCPKCGSRAIKKEEVQHEV